MRVESLERWWMPERWVFLQGLGIKGKGQVATTWLSLRAGSSPGLPCRQAPSSHLLPLRCTLEMILHTSTSPQQAPFTSSCPDTPYHRQPFRGFKPFPSIHKPSGQIRNRARHSIGSSHTGFVQDYNLWLKRKPYKRKKGMKKQSLRNSSGERQDLSKWSQSALNSPYSKAILLPPPSK